MLLCPPPDAYINELCLIVVFSGWAIIFSVSDAVHVYSERIGTNSYQWQDGSPVINHWCPQQPFENSDCLGMLVDYWCLDWGLDDSTCPTQRRFFCE